MYYIYKYVYRNEIIYIGKTKRDLSERIYEHSVELKFLPYLNEAQIFYFTLPTQVEMDIYEKYFINVYMPKLNVVDMDGAEFAFVIKEPIWTRYIEKQQTVQMSVTRPLSKREIKQQELQEQLDLLEQQVAIWDNFDAFLELLFDQYVTTGWDVRSGYVYYIWDMDAYPLPDGVRIDHDTYMCFSISRKIAEHQYENKVSEQVAKILMQQGRDSYKQTYQQLRGQVLDLEYQLERI